MPSPDTIRSFAGYLTTRAGDLAPWMHRPNPAPHPPDQVWTASLPTVCPRCGHSAGHELGRAHGVCSECHAHWRIPARMRLATLLDEGSFVEGDADLVGDDPLDFASPVPYRDLHAAAQRKTGLHEAVVTGHGDLLGHHIDVAVFDFGFMGGTMGVAVGEKLVRLCERATRHRRPIVIVTASGGARLQEGTLSLSQMARVAAAMQRHHAAGLLSISVLTDPTTGGVLVAPGTLGDIVLAEPGAYIAFAGSRVTGSARASSAEWLRERGMVDAVVARPELRETVGRLIELVTRKSRPLPRRPRTAPDLSSLADAPGGGQAIEAARREDRPTALDYIRRLTTDFVELHGDRLHGDDETVVGGIGSLAGQTVVIIGEERSRPADPETRGRPGPEGFRKALRLASLAAGFRLPIITLIDTPGALADAETEGRGLAFAIGRCLRAFSVLPVPMVAAVIGEGTSGAAIALAPADRVVMQQYATFEAISPEGAASILWHDANEAQRVAESMRLTAPDALGLGVIDEIVPEPPGGAHADPDAAAALLGEALIAALAESQRWLPERLIEKRYQRLRRIGEAHLKYQQKERLGVPVYNYLHAAPHG